MEFTFIRAIAGLGIFMEIGRKYRIFNCFVSPYYSVQNALQSKEYELRFS